MSATFPVPYVFGCTRTVTNETGRSFLYPSLGVARRIKYPMKFVHRSQRLKLSAGIGEMDGIIIVDHGSRRKESNLMLNEFVVMFRDKTGYPIIEPAHMELAEPSIKDAFALCVKQGAKRVIVSPFFLFPGRHWHQDIPSLTAEAAKEHLGVSYMITAPLGLHELLVDVVNDRMKQCLSHVSGEAHECSICAGTGKCRVHTV